MLKIWLIVHAILTLSCCFCLLVCVFVFKEGVLCLPGVCFLRITMRDFYGSLNSPWSIGPLAGPCLCLLCVWPAPLGPSSHVPTSLLHACAACLCFCIMPPALVKDLLIHCLLPPPSACAPSLLGLFFHAHIPPSPTSLPFPLLMRGHQLSG